jgi:hypothetical protein
MLESLLKPFRLALYFSARDATQAGIYAGLQTGSGQPELSIEQAAAAYRSLFAAPPADEADATDAPPSLPPLPPSPTAPAEVRKGPGRPRKYQEPPQ